MDTSTKILLGCAFVGVLGVGLYLYKKNNPCPIGQVACPNGNCYDPNLHYKNDPCSDFANQPKPYIIQLIDNIPKFDMNPPPSML